MSFFVLPQTEMAIAGHQQYHIAMVIFIDKDNDLAIVVIFRIPIALYIVTYISMAASRRVYISG